MCNVHQLFSDSLIADESFPKRNSLVRAATAEELVAHSRVRVRVRRARSAGPNPNRVVFDDDEENQNSTGGDAAASTTASVRTVWTSFIPLVLPQPTSCPAAAGSVAQLAGDGSLEEVSYTVGVGVGLRLSTSPGDNINAAASDDEEEESPLDYSSVFLDAMDAYVQSRPLPWKLKDLLPGLLERLPQYDKVMLASNLISYLRGAKTSADIIVRTSSVKAPVRYQGADAQVLDAKSSALLCASGLDAAECFI